MRLLHILALAAILAVPSAAQTCGGALQLQFIDPTSAPSARGLVPISSLLLSAAFVHGETDGQPTVDQARHDPALTWEGEETLGGSRLFVPGTEIYVATRCGTALIHLEIDRYGTVMTLDVYAPPDHLPLTIDAPVAIRAGRFVLDFRTAPEPSFVNGGLVYEASAIRRAM